MEERVVSLDEVLASRERRADRQKWLMELFFRPEAALISFTTVSPGAVKDCGRWRTVFELGCRAVEEALARAGLPVAHREDHLRPTGPEAFFMTTAASPQAVKRLMVRVEEEHPAGRLFDLDVLDGEGVPLSRRDLGLPGRLCLVCSQSASYCGPRQRHSLRELLAAVDRLLERVCTAPALVRSGPVAAHGLLGEKTLLNMEG